MGDLTIYKEEDRGTTVLSNCFIDYYLADANDAQIKVYLYLLRMLSANKIKGISDIADQFNHTEKEVRRALHYWETKGLLSLDYDEGGDIKGIHLIPPKPPRTEQQNDFVPFVTLMPAMETVPSKKEFFKPNYSLDELKEFQKDEKAQEIICIAEQYLKKTLSSSEIRSLFFIMDTLHFSIDLMDYLLQYCVEKGKTRFSYIEKVAVNWATEGITTVEDARSTTSKYDSRIYTIMNALGKSGNPAPMELEFINRWLSEYRFDLDMILEACNRSVKAVDKHRLEYTDKILANWHNQNIHTLDAVATLDFAHRSTQKTAKNLAKSGGNNFQQFAHKDYDFDAIEEHLLNKK